MAMTKQHCKKHPEVEMVTITYCPVCQGSKGGKIAAKRMTPQERSERARKAALTRFAKENK
jgi:uncharacterized Zn finger protein (UPF0148 family)